jgi:aspartate racemase
VVADAVLAAGLHTVGLLGTISTMEKGFYQAALSQRGLSVLTPGPDDRHYVSDVIYNELVAGKFRPEARARYVEIIQSLAGQGAQGVILGCTEIPLLVTQADAGLPLFDTTRIHAEAALAYALK